MMIRLRRMMAAGALALAGVAGAAAPARAGVVFYGNDSAGFNTAVSGQALLGTETFEETTLASGGAVTVNDPLTRGVANGVFAAGLVAPLTIQSNTLGGSATTVSPRGTIGLANFNRTSGFTSSIIISNSINDSTDLIFGASDRVTGVGFDTIAFGTAQLQAAVYSTSNTFLGSFLIAADRAGSNFLGLRATGGDLIGRINLFGSNNYEGADNIAIYSTPLAAPVPEPATLALAVVGLAAVGATRARGRRRAARTAAN